jgi:rod shape-determining protein MreC
MKTRIAIIVLLLLVLAVLLTRNDDRIAGTLLNTINPIKQSYKKFTQGIEDKSHSYIFQKETIEKLSRENRVLRRRLLEQMHYIDQVQNVYDVLPDLAKLPVHNISIAETISYVKLNSFSQIILTKPKGLKEKEIYGLVQGTVVAGVATLKNNQLYGYLTSDDKCRFSVFIGKKKAPGIAIGVKRNEMIVKFIPKWHNVQIGDKVVTSGLDKIFFSNVPVGVVTKVEVQSAYTVAYIKPYNNVMQPKTFFVINDPKVTILENFDANSTVLNLNCPKEEKEVYQVYQEYNTTDSNLTLSTPEGNVTISEQNRVEYNVTIPIISSIPNRVDQTQEDVVEPEEPVEHVEHVEVIKKVKKRSNKKKRAQPRSLDLF